MVLLGLMSIVTLRSVAAQVATTQLVFLLLGFGLFWLVSRFSFSLISQYRWFLYLGLIVLLVATLLIGTFTRNTRRWISVGGYFSIQGSQLATPVVGLAVAHLLATTAEARQKKRTELDIKDIARIGGVIAIPAALIVVAPDLGSTIFFAASVGIIFLLGPIPWRIILATLTMVIAISVAAWLFLLQPYQKYRIYCFIAPQTVAGCSTYNADQALIAVGSGQIFGRGLGQGVQSHLQFLPERQTDFIFASFAEEWGLVGSVTLLGVLSVLVGYIVVVGFSTDKPAAFYYCMMIATLIAFQASVHIGMNMYLFPIKGISLPFVSYGGSSIIGMSLALAIVQSIAQDQKPKLERHFG